MNAQGATTVVGNNNIITVDNKAKLLRILTEIDKLAAAQPNEEYDEISKEIKDELQSEVPKKGLLKRCFQAIPTILTGIGTGIAANALSPLIMYA